MYNVDIHRKVSISSKIWAYMSSDGDSGPNVSAKIGKAAYILQRLRPTQAKGPTIAGYQLIEGKSSVCDLYGIYMIIIRIITYQHGSIYRILQTWKHIMHARTYCAVAFQVVAFRGVTGAQP